MKIALLAAVLMLANAVPTLADEHHDNDGHDNGRMMARHHPMPQRDPRRFHQGQVWHGHHLVYHGGYWGYQQPNNRGFIQINL